MTNCNSLKVKGEIVGEGRGRGKIIKNREIAGKEKRGQGPSGVRLYLKTKKKASGGRKRRRKKGPCWAGNFKLSGDKGGL